MAIGAVGSILTGAAFSTGDPIPSYSSDQCEFLITASGIFMERDTQNDFRRHVNKLPRYSSIANATKANNPSNFGGSGDIVQILLNEVLYAPTVADLRLVQQIEGAANAAKRNGCCCWYVHLVAHSQGTMTVRRALELIGPDTRKHITFLGLGGETTIDKNKYGLAYAKNLAEKDDPVAHQLNSISFWNSGPAPIDFDTHQNYSGFGAHDWNRVYLEHLKKNPSITVDVPKCK